MPTISQVTTITTAYLAGVFFHARSGRSPLAALRVRALGQGVGDEPGVLSCSTIPPRCTPIDISLRLTARSLGQRLCSRTVQRRSGRSPQPSPPYGQSPQLGWCSCSAHRDSPQALGVRSGRIRCPLAGEGGTTVGEGAPSTGMLRIAHQDRRQADPAQRAVADGRVVAGLEG